MKKLIVGLEKDWVVFLFGVIGLLLILFPEPLTDAAPILLGAVLLLRGLAGAVILWRYPKEEIKPGKIVLYLVLGIAILHHTADSIGVIGAIWAMVSLNEVAEEINEAVENRRFSAFRMIMSVVSIVLAVMLLFDPFEHFATHVRVLGLEMLVSVFVRRHNIRKGETG